MNLISISKITLALASLTIFFQITSPESHGKESEEPYRLPITRGLKTKDRLSFNFWNGEYPSPIIDLNSKSKGQTKIQAFTTLRTLEKMKSCTILNGIYHPWSKTANSATNYYSITAIQEYDVLDSSHFGISKTKGNSRIIDVIYLAEGSCKGKSILNKVEKTIEFSCSDLDNKKLATKTSKEDKFDEQWIQLKCQEGGDAFIRDKDLLKIPGAKEGTLLSYGKVGPAKED